jgi:hypothetical protein
MKSHLPLYYDDLWGAKIKLLQDPVPNYVYFMFIYFKFGLIAAVVAKNFKNGVISVD